MMVDFVGQGLWSALDEALFGLPGIGVEKAFGEEVVEEYLTPQTFAGKAGAGVGGLVGGLVVIVTKWTLTSMFSLVKGSLGLLWGDIKLIFGPEKGLIMKTVTWFNKFLQIDMFGETSAIREMIKVFLDVCKIKGEQELDIHQMSRVAQ